MPPSPSSATVGAAAKAALPKFRFLTAWFCPYAHRAKLALEHHIGRIEYESVEALGWQQREDKDNVTGASQEWYYHWKADELLRCNPSGLVPTLIPYDSTQDTYDESKSVYESLVVVDYVDSMSGATGPDRLNPVDDPYWEARCRIWTDKVNRECCSPYYGVLVRKDEQERNDHFKSLIGGLERFSTELTKTSGPLFLGDGRLSNVDLALFPWACRYFVLEHYRGPQYTIPQTKALEPFHAWYRHMRSIESVQRTLVDEDKYLDHIRKYADGTARSKVANAVRRGVAAHELDDAKDEA